MTTDIVGNTLNVGDTVVVLEPKVFNAKYRSLTTGVIEKITNCYFFVKITADHPHKGRVVPRSRDQLARVSFISWIPKITATQHGS